MDVNSATVVEMLYSDKSDTVYTHTQQVKSNHRVPSQIVRANNSLHICYMTSLCAGCGISPLPLLGCENGG